MSDLPNIPAAAGAELVSLFVDPDMTEQQMEVRLRFDNGTEVELGFPLEGPAVAELLDLLSRLATEVLAPLGQSGLTIHGIAAPPDDLEDD